MRTIDATHYLIDVSVEADGSDASTQRLPDFGKAGKLIFHPKVTYIIGENGSGKSTLLEAVATAFGMNAEGGGRNFSFTADEQGTTLKDKVVLNKGINKPKDDYFVSAEAMYRLRKEIDELFETSLRQQSHGESFLNLISNRFRGNGLYILDEPEAALSPLSQFKFLVLLHQLVGKNSQFIIATHSPIILGYPESKIFQIRDRVIEETEYEETSQYQLTKHFLDNRAGILEELIYEK